MSLTRRLLLAMGVSWAGTAVAGETLIPATVYKDPNCSCCGEYVKYLGANGFRVKVVPMDDMQPVKRQNHIPKPLESCHTTLIDGYVVEGHVPVAAIKKLLAERPKINGISVPGMPAGSPGMNGTKTEPLQVYEIAPDKARVYFTEP